MLPIIQLALGLAPVVPELVRWISGGDEKATAAATMIVDVAEAVTGKKGAEAVEQVRADPAVMLEFRQRAMELDGQLEAAYLKDRQDARNRDVELAKAGRKNYRSDFLAFLSVIALMFCVWFVATNADMADGAREAVMFIAGVFAAAVRDVYSFEFGSSRGSKEKDEVIASFQRDKV